jgi:hypothetical protein
MSQNCFPSYFDFILPVHISYCNWICQNYQKKFILHYCKNQHFQSLTLLLFQGNFKDVSDLLKSDEVKTFLKMKWGGGPVKFFWGFAEMNNSNKSVWDAHVIKIDRLVGQIFPMCILISIICILSVRNLAGLGNAPVPLPGLPDL